MHKLLRVGGMVVAVSVLGLAHAPAAPVPDDPKVAAAHAAARAWLALVDTGQYGRSWTEAGSLFRNAISEDTWRMQLTGVRKPLGRVIRREVIGARSMTSIPGGPDGAYVVIQFRTQFERKASAIETVTPMMDTDGIWRVAGYYIR